MKNSKLKIRGLSIIRDYRYLMVIAMLGIVFTLFGLSPAITAAEALFEEQYYEAVVINIVESGQEQTDPDNWIVEQEVELRLLSGERQGETITAKNSLSGTVGMDIDLQPGDRVIVYSILQDNVIQESYIAERVRAPYIKYLVLLFVVVLVVVGGLQGAKALVGLGFTVGGIYYLLLPGLLKGYSPLPITIAVLIGVTLLTMLVIAGFTRKAAAAWEHQGLLVAGFSCTSWRTTFLRGLNGRRTDVINGGNLPLICRDCFCGYTSCWGYYGRSYVHCFFGGGSAYG